MYDLPQTNRLRLAIGLPLRNHRELNQLLRQIYNPASTNYHHYLTPQEFAEEFGPTPQDYAAVLNFARTNGFTVTATYPNRTLMDVNGSVATVEKAFHVKLQVYQHPTGDRNFFSPDTEPSVDLNVPILHISGLNNFNLPRPAGIRRKSFSGFSPAAGSGPNGLLMGSDFRNAYTPGVTFDGAGQVVALFELDGYYTNDIAAYESDADLPATLVTNVLVDGYSGVAEQPDDAEVALDIEMVISMATNLAEVVVYEEENTGDTGDIADLLNR
ncbi:MAG TPA: protease pro-enzyme activation domain-containing protein, partial [Verrucomicrobiae bacterium]|nr:protease pro-enzyme activation domain-containing protein [Verrucomicrobiae bacterium]